MRRLLYLLALLLLMSCEQKITFKESRFTFKIPQKEIYVKTSKRPGGTFVLFFAKDSLSLTDCKDSIEYGIRDDLFLVVDTTNIYMNETYAWGIRKIGNNKYEPYMVIYTPDIKNLGQSKFNIKVLPDSIYALFYENKALKAPYSKIIILPKEYHIRVNGQVIKKGDIYGGW